jgi:hypothetical protein
LSESNVYASDRFYQIFTRKDFLGLSFYLISTLFAFFSEVTAKHQLGLGALDLNIFEFVKIPVLNLTKIPSALFEKMQQAFRKLSERNCGSVFEEIGANNPEDVSLDKVKSDRRELDEIIMGDILGLSKREQLEVYRGLLRLVKDRLEKAQTGD